MSGKTEKEEAFKWEMMDHQSCEQQFEVCHLPLSNR